MHAEQHRIKRAQAICHLRCVERARWIPGLAVHKRKRVVSKRVAGAQTDGVVKLASGTVMLTPKPQGPAHCAMCRRVAGIGFQSLPRSLESQGNLTLALTSLQQECVLKMCK
jgi:hypothetical protein